MVFDELSLIVHLGTDSNAAKSFVNRRGLGKMRHIEIRDLWLQKEIREGKVEVHKVLGTENPADLMTKILTVKEIEERLRRMSITMRITNEVRQMASVETSESRRVARTQTSEMRKGRPAPISSFGAGRVKIIFQCVSGNGTIDPPPILPFGGGQCEFRVYLN